MLLERHGRGEATLYPPTWVTLHHLSGQPHVEALLGMLRLTGLRRFETIARRSDAGPMLLWEGDADYGHAEHADTARGDAWEETATARRRARGDAALGDLEQLGAAHPDAARGAASARHRLELGSLPWVYTRSE